MPRKPDTPQEVLFRSFFAGLQSDWTRQKYYKLCIKLNLTEFELGALLGLSRFNVTTYINANKFPLPVCRHLQSVDRFIKQKRCEKLEPDPWEDYLNER